MLIYLAAVSGIMINIHYCGQQMESWSVFSSKEGCGKGECGDESNKADGCCKDKTIAAKVSQEQNVASVFKIKVTHGWHDVVLPAYPAIPELSLTATSVPANTHMPHAPPGRWQQIALYKLHSSFTYYG
jgi:hypothetical protein